MSKKNLLNEATVRRFMKLAEIGPLTSGFISEQYPHKLKEMGLDTSPVYQDDDEPEAELPPEEEVEMDVELEDDVGVEPEAEEEVEMEVEEEGLGELTLTDEEAEAFLKVADKVRDAMDIAPEPLEVPAPDMGEEEEFGAVDAGEEEEPGEGEELEDIELADETIVTEVAQRVAKRLLARAKK